ncbi:secreted RxLR effector protein 161-like [Miscanthus floridulus]|uniref:secreted RxLR effector protein 161-like n=1 Tax=Miscanthus floridulus TaxID=154761 RepID=UPI0034589743
MKKAFNMSDLGLLYFYLSIKVRQDASRIALHQIQYAKRILELGGMTGCNLAHTLIEEKLKLSRESTTEEVDPTHYRWLIGSLRYLVNTRPDIAFIVGYMSQFMEWPMMEHLQAVKRILCYMAGTLDYGLHYGRAPRTARFIGYCDSDLAGDVDTSKNTTGVMFFLGDCLVSWQSLKQKVLAL